MKISIDLNLSADGTNWEYIILYDTVPLGGGVMSNDEGLTEKQAADKIMMLSDIEGLVRMIQGHN